VARVCRGLGAACALLAHVVSVEARAEEQSPENLYHETAPPVQDSAQAGPTTSEQFAHDQPRQSSMPASIGLQAFTATEKAMGGLDARLGDVVALKLEGSLLWATRRPAELNSAFLGSQFGIFVDLAPWDRRQWQVDFALGADIYYLWGIHGDLAEVALAAVGSAGYWVSDSWGIFGSARGYVLATDGLELGTTRAGEPALPVLFSLGVRWRNRP